MTLTLRLGLSPGFFVQRLSTARKPMYGTAVRSFHRPAAAPRPSSAPSKWTRSVLARGGGAQRAYHQEIVGVPRPNLSRTRRLLLGGAVFGTTLLAINVVMNREGRDDGGMPAFERDYLTSTLVHTSLGVGIIGLTARQLVRNGVVFRIMFANPWLVGIGGLVLSFATMIGTRSISPDNYVAKYAMWTAFNATQAALVAPLLVVAPAPVLARAGLYSVGVMGALALVAATAKQEKYLYMGGPLLAGATVVLLSGLAPLVLPATAVRTLAVSQNLWLYGGLCVFGGLTLYDVQKVLHHARLAQAGVMKRDPVNESISLELDFLNIFIRLVQIMGNSRNK